MERGTIKVASPASPAAASPLSHSPNVGMVRLELPQEIEDNMKEAIELYLEDNPNPCEVLSGEFELKFKIDAATFINYYSSIFTKAALSRITGINERQLWHYAAGVHKPRRRQLEKIQKGIQSLSRELSAINLL